MSTHTAIKTAAVHAMRRVIGQAFLEGATRESIVAHLRSEGVQDPDPIIDRVKGLSKCPRLGEVELSDYGGRDAFRALFNLPPAMQPAAPAAPAEPLTPISLVDAHTVYRRWMGENYDLAPFDAVLATMAAERLDGDLVWLLVIGAPADGKTETVSGAAGAGWIVTSTIDSKGALLSGTSKKEQSQQATGGLLAKIGPRGGIVIKDFTSLLEMNREARAEVFAALREVYDGAWERNVGADGGKTLTWKGRIGLIAAVTTAWDKAREALASMGERFLNVRMHSNERRLEKGQQALDNLGQEVRMRADLREVVGRVLAGAQTAVDPLTKDEQERLLHAANLVTRCRTAVDYDHQGRVIDSHDAEAPTRLLKQLAQIVRGARAIGVSHDEAMTLAIRCAHDSVRC